MNPTKSVLVVISLKMNNSKFNINLLYNNSVITCKDSSKYLGVITDSNFNYKTHKQLIATKISRSIGILNKLRSLFPSSTLLLLYHTLVHPHFLFALPVWGGSYLTNLKKLQRLQNKAVRIITNAKFISPITPHIYFQNYRFI